MQNLGFVEVWISGFLDFWISGFLDFWISGFYKDIGSNIDAHH
jgi:hypothetical protein